MLKFQQLCIFPSKNWSSLITITKTSITRPRFQMGFHTTPSYASKYLFRQLFEKESSTYTYLLADVSHPEKPALVGFLLYPFLLFFHFLQWFDCRRIMFDFDLIFCVFDGCNCFYVCDQMCWPFEWNLGFWICFNRDSWVLSFHLSLESSFKMVYNRNE